jgi:hydroxyethylthiazole kinase-like uncharacterized protein yjeF
MQSESLRAPRNDRSHKYSHGHLAAVVGSEKYPGAALLSLGGALRGGSGYICNLSISEKIDLMICDHYPEITFASSLSALAGDAWLIGSGVEEKQIADELPALQRAIADSYQKTQAKQLPFFLTLDAAGMKFVSELQTGFTIITPHEGEAMALGVSAESLLNRKQAALELSRNLNVIVVLKGYHTIVASPSGFWAKDTYGGAELAVAGTGDILGGLITSFLGAFKPTTEKNVVAIIAKAIKAHSLAGKYASKRYGNTTASDVLTSLTKVIR